ncbi:hypothetical protein [Nocardia caishijiensis]|nr:hypothetical protein [Nocardia caishijiensis]
MAETGDTACPACGWVLTAGPWLGGITPQRRQQFDDELTFACRQLDLRAAARVAAVVGGERAALLELVRGARASEAELDPGRRQVGTAESDITALEPLLGWLIAAPARTRTLTVIDIDSRGVEVYVLAADDRGVVRPIGAPRTVAWSDLVSGLSASPTEALFQLAGGVGVLGRGCRIDRARVDRELPSSASMGQVHVLHRLPGWPIPEALAAGYPEVHRVGGARDSARLVRRAAPYTPLRHGYRLLTVEVDRSGRTEVRHVPLFPAGTRAVDGRKVTVDVAVPSGCGELLVAITEDHAGGRHLDAVCVFRWIVPEVETTALEFELDGPGDVRVDGLGSLTIDAVAGVELATAVQAIPATHRPSDAVDVALAVELCGSAEEVERRTRSLADWLAELADRHRHRRGVRVAILGYHDHLGQHRRGVVRVHEFGSITATAAAVAELAPSQVRGSGHLAPLEDVLELAATLTWRQPAAARRLVIVGRRAPYGDDTPCPNRVRWQESLARLRDNGIEVLAVWDTPPGFNPVSRRGRSTATVWRELSLPGESRELGKVTPGWLVDRLRVPAASNNGVALVFPMVAVSTEQEINK